MTSKPELRKQVKVYIQHALWNFCHTERRCPQHKGCLLLTERRNHHFVLGSFVWAHPWWKVAGEPQVHHSEQGKRRQLLLTFSCHIWVPPTAKVKFHQKPKQGMEKPNVTWSPTPWMEEWHSVLFNITHLIWKNNIIRYLDISTWLVQLPPNFH